MTLILIPLISAFIGWCANRAMIKLLFHPRLPVKVLGSTIQGVFPKRQEQFAKKIAGLVANEFQFDQIATGLKNTDKLKELEPVIEAHLDNFLRVKLQEKIPAVAMFIGESTIGKLKDGMMEEIGILLPEIIERYTDSLGKQIDIEQIVSSKIAKFSSDKLEEILMTTMSKEFRTVEIIGAAVGFVIGLLQVLLTLGIS